MCVVCLDQLKDPLTIPCGHRYCRKCLQNCLRYLIPTADSREDFLQFWTGISLDPDSAHRGLSLSEGNRRVTVIRKLHRGHHNHPDRFTNYCQVLSRAALPERSYWELEWSGDWLRVAVSYRDIQRKGVSPKCAFGFSENSWALCLEKSQSSVWSEGVQSQPRVSGPAGSRIGVFVDRATGVLSFYSVSETTMRLLYRVYASFSRPLFAGVGLNATSHRDTVKFTKLK